MLNREEALKIASAIVTKMMPAGNPWMIVELSTIETEAAWVFFYNTKDAIENTNPINRLAGNEPIFIDKETAR